MSSIDFAAALAGDTSYQEALAAIQQQRAAAQSSLDAGNYQDLIRLGMVPTLPTGSALNFQVPQSIQDLITQATQSGFSQIGQLQRQYALNQSALRGNLGDRNAVNSGDYAYQTNKNLQAQQLGRATDVDQFMTALGNRQQGYLSQLGQLQSQQTSAESDAWNRMQTLIQARSAADAAAAAQKQNQDFLNSLLNQQQPAPVPIGGGGGGAGGGGTVIPNYGGGSVPSSYVQGSAGRGSQYAPPAAAPSPPIGGPLAGAGQAYKINYPPPPPPPTQFRRIAGAAPR